MYKKGKKIIASVVVFMLMMAHVSTLGVNIGKVFAVDLKLENQNSKTQHSNVEFNTYFEDEKYETVKNIGEENKIVAQISIKNAGYLKDARIDFVDSNFKISNELDSEKIVRVENNSIVLNQIDNGENINLEIPFIFDTKNIISEEQLNKISSVVFTGTYIDEKGKECKINKDIQLNLNWTLNTEAVLEAEIVKYVPYNVNEQKGLIMQVDIKSNLKDNVLPIKENRIEISVPEINGVAPQNITVYNKKNIENFTFDYDKENAKVTIIVQNNKNENGEILFDNSLLNEFIITYKYSETALAEQANVVINADSNIKVYSYDEKEFASNFNGEATLTEKIGDIIDFRLESEENLSKGYIYTNYNTTEKVETIYKEKVRANIALPELVDGIKLSLDADKFVIDDKEYSSNAYYKNLKIDKTAWMKILGEEGIIKITSENYEVVIDKNTEVSEIELNLKNLNIETSKPITDGELVFNFEKAISGENSYTKVQMEKVQALKQEITAVVVNSNETIVEKNENIKLNFVEPQTVAELQINNTNLSTVVTNENIELKVILKTDSIYNKLYENPNIKITLPSYVENINIKNIQLLFEDELTVESSNIIQNNDGTKQIEVKFSGIQTKYDIGSISEGTNLVITADITTNNLTPNKQEKVTMTCINGNEQVESVSIVNFIAPIGIVTVNKIEDFVQGASVMALTENEEVTLEVQAASKNAKAEIQIINNYNNIINNVRILGRTLVQGTNNIDSDESLENTFDAPMISAINTNGFSNVTIYYTENGKATEDLNNVENGWQTEVQDYSKVKSYLIVLNDYVMNIGDSVKFNYDIQIPENLGYSETVSSLYTVYFDNIKEEQTINDRVKASMLTLGTGVAPELQVELKSNSLENSIVREGQYVKFTATVKNIGTVDAENVKLNITAPNGKVYTYMEDNNILFTEDISKIENLDTQLAFEYTTKHTQFVQDNYTSNYIDSDEQEKVINIGTLPAGTTTEVVYELKMESTETYDMNLYANSEGELVKPETIFSNVVRVMADDLQKEVVSNEYKLNIQKGYMTIRTSADKFEDYVLVKGSELVYSAKVEQQYSEGSLKNVVLKMQIPEGLTIKETSLENLVISDYELEYKSEVKGNVITFEVKELPVGGIFKGVVKTEVDSAIGNIETYATVEAEGTGIHYSNITKNKVSKVEISFKQNAISTQYVKEKGQITFTYNMENTSDVFIDELTFKNIIPDGLKFVSAKVIRDKYDRTITKNDSENFIEYKITNIDAKEQLTIEVTMEAELLPNGTTEKEITNYATISGNMFDEITSNSIKAIIEYSKDAHTNTDGTTDVEKDGRYIVSGIAWLDTNSNGQRDEEETILSGIEVRLLNKNTNEIVKDIDSNVDKIVHTGSNGEYRFTNLEAGEYIVVFVYNSAKYDLTEYRAKGVENSVNSDFINTTMQINGKEQNVAISDTIKIVNDNARNIDVGLIESNKSDLRLDKYISSITLTYGNTVKTYDYENVKLAKVEIPAKELSNATVIVDYKIVVTNEGAVGNYIKKVVDYMPKDMKFNSELNRDWYQSSNGDLYNSSLANTKLESGESKELTLTLTKKMTDSNVGIVNNNAELYEVYNEEGIMDIDSTPANKVNGEDDLSSADVVISVKTGDAIMYTTIISAIICIVLGVSIYYIRKIVLRKI